MDKRQVQRGRRTVRMITLSGATAILLATGLLLASCASSGDAATSSPVNPAPPNPSPVKSDTPKPAPVKDEEGLAEPAKASANEFAEIGEKPSEGDVLREGKEEITVLVLNACGVEGAAAEAAEKVKALGFTNVKTGNATFHQQDNRVSYHHEEHRAEVEEVAALFEYLPPYDPYCYEDAWTGGWSMDYDILVMVGRPSAS